MYRPHHLLDLLACPRTGGELVLKDLDGEGVLLSAAGVAYPIIRDIVVTKPSSSTALRLCEEFFDRQGGRLAALGGEFDGEGTRRALFESGGEEASWHLEEMDYWEKQFEAMLSGGRASSPGPNRTIPRARLLRRLPGGFERGRILELGCGSSETLSEVYGPSLVNYIGLDLSFNACLFARRAIPGGLFLQGAVESLPVKRNALDAVVAYGVFHHLPGHERIAGELFSYLREGGFLVGADPLGKPSVPRPFRRRTPGMSPHNEWIDWDNLVAITAGTAAVREVHLEYGPLRTLMVKLFYDGLGLRSRVFTNFMLAVDALWLATAGRIHPSFGPAAVHYILQTKRDGAGGG